MPNFKLATSLKVSPPKMEDKIRSTAISTMYEKEEDRAIHPQPESLFLFFLLFRRKKGPCNKVNFDAEA